MITAIIVRANPHYSIYGVTGMSLSVLHVWLAHLILTVP